MEHKMQPRKMQPHKLVFWLGGGISTICLTVAAIVGIDPVDREAGAFIISAAILLGLAVFFVFIKSNRVKIDEYIKHQDAGDLKAILFGTKRKTTHRRSEK